MGPLRLGWTPLSPGAQGVRRAGAAAQADAFARWLELQAHVQLFALCRDVGAAAERLANVVLKQQPNAGCCRGQGSVLAPARRVRVWYM